MTGRFVGEWIGYRSRSLNGDEVIVTLFSIGACALRQPLKARQSSKKKTT